MRTLHSIASIDPSYGGPKSVLQGLSGSLRKLGVTQTILTSSTGDPVRDRNNALAFSGIDIFWAKPLVYRYYWDPFLKHELTKRLQGFDLCHVHGVFNGISHTVCRMARKHGIPYLLEPFGTLSPYCLAKSAFIKRVWLALGERKNIENAAAVKFSSQGEYQRFNANFSARLGFVTGIGLDWSEFADEPEPSSLRRDLGISQNEIVFFFLGRLQPIKGLEIFIPAFLRWRKAQAGKIRLVIAGPDEADYRKKLECLAKALGAGDAILFAGPIYGQRRIQAMKESDIIVLPSYHENFGITVAEGMACGKPVLISDQVDISPEVTRLDLGEVASLNIESIIAALDRIFMRIGDWGSIGQRGRKWAEKECDWDRISEIILAEYKKIACSFGGVTT